MRPCPAELVTSATHRVMWNDSDGVLNVAHCGPGGFGPIVPIAARETVLVLRRALAAQVAAEALSDTELATMAATTTDRDPVQILSVGLETTARALVQHAYLADQTSYRSPGEFSSGLEDSGLFAVVANTWFWGLQSSTFRRGMIPVALTTLADGTVRYTAESSAMLRVMKDATIASPDPEDAGLTRQYEPLRAGEQPRCLANVSATVDGRRLTLLPGVVDTFVETFVRLLELVEVNSGPKEEVAMSSPVDEVFEVPDMTCSHCTNTVTEVLRSNGVTVSGIDLETKKVVAAFPSPDVREACFEEIRDRGYTVIPAVAS
jgi:copper chaperone CopZ